MTYVVTSTCIDVKDGVCQKVCPVECIYEGGRMMYIQPDECINCGICVSVCPVQAIYEDVDVPGEEEEFIAANAAQIGQSFGELPGELRGKARLIFTAHSIPLDMANRCRYAEQLMTAGRLIAEQLGIDDFVFVYQSRSGRPEDPWLGPDVCDYLREERARGLEAAVLCPIGFVCDHVEVLYDLDVEALETARAHGITLHRASTVGDHPAFISALADLVVSAA